MENRSEGITLPNDFEGGIAFENQPAKKKPFASFLMKILLLELRALFGSVLRRRLLRTFSRY